MKKWVSLCVYCPATPRATTPSARRRVDDELDELSRETKKHIDATNIPLDTFFAPGKVTLTRMIFQNTKQETSRVPPHTRESYNCFEQKSIDDDDDDAFCLQ